MTMNYRLPMYNPIWHKIKNIISQWLYYMNIVFSIFFESPLKVDQIAWKKKGDSENSPLTYRILWVKLRGKTDSVWTSILYVILLP